MRKKLTTVLLVFAILLTYTPSHIFAQECMEHTWGEWHKMFDSTCTEDGLQRRICKECYVEETKPIPAIGHHTWGEWETSDEPTCAYTGTATRTCNVCDESEEKTLPKSKNHSWLKWRTTKKATALSKGTKSRYCWECDKTEKKSIPKLKAKVKLKKKSATIKSGKSYTIKIKSKTYGDKVKKWTSSNRKVATVNSHGKVTGKRKGVAIITLKMKSGVKATCKIKVTKPKQNNSHQPGGSGSEPGGSGSEPGGNDTPPPPADYVWIPRTGKKYHRSSTCSGMKDPRQVPLQDAINAGYGPCSRCY